MIAFLKGEIKYRAANYLIIDTGGVGYKVYCDPFAFAKEDKVEIFTYHHIREDLDELYGFADPKDLYLFELLISVNGIGPKAAANIMNSAKSSEIIAAISLDNLAFFKIIPGIGNKVAAKIILELKSKVSSNREINILASDQGGDIIEALVGLGYKRQDAALIVSKIPADITDSEAKIRWSLKNL